MTRRNRPLPPVSPGCTTWTSMTIGATADEWGMAAHARSTPDKPAMVLDDAVRTYGELASRAARLASVFHDLGVPSDGTGAVAAMVPNGFEFFEVAAAACRVEAR